MTSSKSRQRPQSSAVPSVVAIDARCRGTAQATVGVVRVPWIEARDAEGFDVFGVACREGRSGSFRDDGDEGVVEGCVRPIGREDPGRRQVEPW
jgi:hypothetical protein